MGKIGSTSSVPFLRTILEDIKDSDPLFLPHLALEISWLSGATHIPWIVAQCFCSPSYLTRWAGLNILDQVQVAPDDELWQLKYDAIVSLAADAADRVRATARFLQEEMDFEASLPTIETRAEKRRRRKELEKRRPDDFHCLSIGFRNWIHERRVSTYTIQYLCEFVRGLPDGS